MWLRINERTNKSTDNSTLRIAECSYQPIESQMSLTNEIRGTKHSGWSDKPSIQITLFVFIIILEIFNYPSNENMKVEFLKTSCKIVTKLGSFPLCIH